MKTPLLIYITALTTVLITLFGSSTGWAAEPQVRDTACKLLGLSQIEFSEKSLHQRLVNPAFSAKDKIHCQKVVWEQEVFYTLSYPIGVPISYSGKVEKSLNYVVYRQDKKTLKLKQVSADIMKQQGPYWSLQNKHLVLRWLSKGQNGQAVLSGGYVFSPKTKSFKDYALYSHEKRWQTVDRPN